MQVVYVVVVVVLEPFLASTLLAKSTLLHLLEEY